MKFSHFRFKNFKGIEEQTLDLTKSSESNIFTLVGLNESGKTTILEAINYFAFKPESLDVLGIKDVHEGDIHNLIPINKRDNFNDYILIEAGLELNDEEIQNIKELLLKEHEIVVSEISNKVDYIQKYHFKNSIHQKDLNESLWRYHITGKKKREKKNKKIANENAFVVSKWIKDNLPSILYFPNFLFEFPERIYLDDTTDSKHIFYQNIIQDLLDSLNNDTNIKDHLSARINSEDKNDKRNLNSLIGKMESQLTKIVFKSWNEIFNKEISMKEIVLYPDSDKNGKYLEFNIKDDVDTYRISERSLGFRWYFVYILLTQFRSFRKKNSNAFFLFDEPASNLHPSAQTELLKSFENLPNVLYTTHSHYLINPKWLESTYVVKNKGIDYDNEASFDAKNTDISVMKYRVFASKYPNQSSYFQPILEILDYAPSKLEMVPKVVITEGKNDFYTFLYYQEIIKEYKRVIKFIPGTSASNLKNIISLYLGWGTNFIVLLDSDDEGKKQKEKYIEEFGLILEDKVITYEDIFSEWSNFETENLFSENDRIMLQISQYPDHEKYNKKMFNRSIQENYVMSKKLVLDNITNKNFKKVIDYLRDKLKK